VSLFKDGKKILSERRPDLSSPIGVSSLSHLDKIFFTVFLQVNTQSKNASDGPATPSSNFSANANTLRQSAGLSDLRGVFAIVNNGHIMMRILLLV
jgi:hypothetical protein